MHIGVTARIMFLSRVKKFEVTNSMMEQHVRKKHLQNKGQHSIYTHISEMESKIVRVK